jgi:hypothetical protein
MDIFAMIEKALKMLYTVDEVIKVGKTSSEAKIKYRKKAYDRIEVLVQKGVRETYVEHAASMGESLSGFIVRAVERAMAEDNERKASTESP